jgi:hypothetical protein
MQRYALTINGTVRDIFAVGPDDKPLAERLHPDVAAMCVPVGADVHAGWVVDGDGFTAPPAVQPATPPAPKLTRRQLRLQLLAIGITSEQVEAAIAELPEADRAVAMIEWQDASEYVRAHPLIDALAPALGLTTEQLDAAWAQAATL